MLRESTQQLHTLRRIERRRDERWRIIVRQSLPAA